MAKRVVVEFICDECSRIVSIEHCYTSFAGSVAKVHCYPKGWRMSRQQDKTLDICPECEIPIVETKLK